LDRALSKRQALSADSRSRSKAKAAGGGASGRMGFIPGKGGEYARYSIDKQYINQ
jgi:hypothetical protein